MSRMLPRSLHTFHQIFFNNITKRALKWSSFFCTQKLTFDACCNEPKRMRTRIAIQHSLFLLLCIALPILLYFNIIPAHFKYYLLFIALFYIGLDIYVHHIPLRRLGIYTRITVRAVALYALVAIGGIVVAYSFAFHFHTPRINVFTTPSLLYTFLFSSFFQELIYRSYLFYVLKQFSRNPMWIIGVSAILFSFLHIIFTPLSISIPITLLLGLSIGIAYYYYPNLFLATCSHAILNVFVSYLCLFSGEQLCQ